MRGRQWLSRRTLRGVLLLLAATVYHENGAAVSPSPTPPSFAVGAYIPEYRLDGLDRRREGLTDAFLFSLSPSTDGELDDDGVGGRLLASARAAGARRSCARDHGGFQPGSATKLAA
ncbi:hypothetical protein T492DRAFT_842518 [Pavlovales sp. CCMP2436]|nr:hypothetical protein T492DRAFT_842518 [Pavlovales sp. CCMP2436]